jgi:hypothetical protein
MGWRWRHFELGSERDAAARLGDAVADAGTAPRWQPRDQVPQRLGHVMQDCMTKSKLAGKLFHRGAIAGFTR